MIEVKKNIISWIKYKHFVYIKNIINEGNIFTHLTIEEKFKLYQLALSKKGVFVEIGSYLGASATFIALAISEINNGSKLYCVDTWQNDYMTEGKRDTFEIFLKNTIKFRNYITPLRGESNIVANNFNKSIDFLFIDGDHNYKGVKSDFNAWFPKLNTNALVIFHDIGWAEGVQKVVEENVKPLAKKHGQLPNLFWAYL